MNEKFRNILIIGSQPFNPSNQSRMYSSFFDGWPKDKLAQIFSDRSAPIKGHCSTLFQITDKMMVKKFFNYAYQPGTIYDFEKLNDSNVDNFNKGMLKIGSYRFKIRKNGFFHLMRGLLWRGGKWYTANLEKWIETFKPEMLFLCLHNDFFINQICLFIAKKYKLPIIISIVDDYYFSLKHNFFLFNNIYVYLYKKLFKNLIKQEPYCVFISDKIKNKYCSTFKIFGHTQFLCSDYPLLDSKISLSKPNNYIYFGGLGYKRIDSLILFAKELYAVNKDATIECYLNWISTEHKRKLSRLKNILLKDSVKHDLLLDKIKKSDICIFLEALKDKKSISLVEYSLSTKISDLLTCNRPIFAIGNEKSGSIDFLIQNKCAIIATDGKSIKDNLNRLYSSGIDLESIMESASETRKKFFSKEKNLSIFLESIGKIKT